MNLIDTLKVGNELGEGVIWDHSISKLWWTDIQQSRLYRYDPQSKELEQWATPERLCCFAPRANNRELNSPSLVAAFETGFAFYTPETGEVQWISKLETTNPGTRFNDGRTDRQGRFWAATMVEDTALANDKGALYCLNHDLTATKTIGGLSIPNSLCWSPDGQTMYHTDTPTMQIKQYDFDCKAGTFERPRVFATSKKGGYPDGSCIDAQGFLWNAQWGSSTVVRYSPEGELDLVVDIPASQPSCVAFGGRNFDIMFVTSAWQGLNNSAKQADPEAGNLFIYETNHTGLPQDFFIER